MELWYAATCPYCQRVRIALAEKGLEVAERVVDLAGKPPELLALNPAGTVPVLVVDGLAIPDSLAILEYLEDRFPQHPLLPPAGPDRERARLLYDRITSGLGPHVPKAVRGSGDEKARADQAIRTALAALEPEMPEDGYLAGSFSIADLALVPFMARLPRALAPPALGLPRLARWELRTRARPSVAAVLGSRSPAG